MIVKLRRRLIALRALLKMHIEFVCPTLSVSMVELQTKVFEDYTITDKAALVDAFSVIVISSRTIV